MAERVTQAVVEVVIKPGGRLPAQAVLAGYLGLERPAAAAAGYEGRELSAAAAAGYEGGSGSLAVQAGIGVVV